MTPESRIEHALKEVKPGHHLYELALAFKHEGFSQDENYELFDCFRSEHEDDQDETVLNVILDTMDFIGGHCSSHMYIYGDDAEN